MGLRDKLDNLTGSSSGYDGETHTGDVDYEDFIECVECFGDMVLYTYAAQATLESSDSTDAEIRLEVMEELSSNALDTAGVFNVMEICEKHDIDFKSEVMGDRV